MVVCSLPGCLPLTLPMSSIGNSRMHHPLECILWMREAGLALGRSCIDWYLPTAQDFSIARIAAGLTRFCFSNMVAIHGTSSRSPRQATFSFLEPMATVATFSLAFYTEDASQS